jgi:hypothetical protein
MAAIAVATATDAIATLARGANVRASLTADRPTRGRAISQTQHAAISAAIT